MPASLTPTPTPTSDIDTLLLFRQRLLKALLLIGAVAILLIWFVESNGNRLMVVNSVLYPVMVLLFILYLIILQFKPESLPFIEIMSFSTLATYELIYLYAVVYRVIPEIKIYDMATFMQWFPLVYTSAFIFMRTREARLVSILIYLITLFPTLHQQFFSNMPFMSSEISTLLLSMNISHPVYILVLAGIASLKENAVQARSDAETLSIAANIDYLTGVANRRSTVSTLQQMIEHTRAGNQVLGVMLIDIDYFKNINDTFGHDSGDRVLIRFAEALRTILPAPRAFGRWGGEEFLAIVADSSRDQILQLAERVRSQLELLDYPEVGPVTASIGVATLTADDTVETLVKRADQALYRAKEHGRNCVEIDG